MQIVLGFLLIGWIFNLCKEIIVDMIEAIAEKNFIPIILIVSVITVACLITWWLYHIGLADTFFKNIGL